MSTQDESATVEVYLLRGGACPLASLRMFLLAVLAAGTAFEPVTSSAQGNLVFNGSFESANLFSGWTGSGYLTNGGWQGRYLQCPDGLNAAGLAPQASIYQDIPTVIGQQYDFKFYMAGWGPNTMPPEVILLSPSFGATSLGTVSFSCSGKFDQDMGWESHDYTATATSTSTRIMFLNTSPTSTYIWDNIDAVSVTAIPEPSWGAVLLLGSAVGLGSRSLGRLRSGRVTHVGLSPQDNQLAPERR